MRSKNQRLSDIYRSLERMDERIEVIESQLSTMISSADDWGEIERSLEAARAELSAVRELVNEEKRKGDTET